MLVFLTTEAYQNTLRGYVRSYGTSLSRRVRLRSYERLATARRLWRATYVFADLERLAPPEAEQAAALWRRLADRGDCRLLNHPTRSMRRYELLRTLYEQGVNRFDVYRAAEGRTPARFPVFVRGENDHEGSRTPLLYSPAELQRTITALVDAGASPDEVLITEFCDTRGPDGLYRKYAAFLVGDRLVPRHVFFRDDWMVKSTARVDEALLREERAYMRDNPHADALRAIFVAARIEYGRVDYAVLDGAVQVWEINTNPLTVSFRFAGGPARLGIQTRFAADFTAALEALDARG